MILDAEKKGAITPGEVISFLLFLISIVAKNCAL
jgi:hypothetical protein